MAYDVVVIGAGPGGYVCAIKAAAARPQGRLVEKRADAWRHLPQCRLHSVQGAAPRLRDVRRGRSRLRRTGIDVGTPKLNLDADDGAQGRRSVGQNTKGIEFLFKKNKVDVIRGAGRIGSPARSR